jgi:hypothetical protein
MACFEKPFRPFLRHACGLLQLCRRKGSSGMLPEEADERASIRPVLCGLQHRRRRLLDEPLTELCVTLDLPFCDNAQSQQLSKFTSAAMPSIPIAAGAGGQVVSQPNGSASLPLDYVIQFPATITAAASMPAVSKDQGVTAEVAVAVCLLPDRAKLPSRHTVPRYRIMFLRCYRDGWQRVEHVRRDVQHDRVAVAVDAHEAPHAVTSLAGNEEQDGKAMRVNIRGRRPSATECLA